jgi:hypothetical protein
MFFFSIKEDGKRKIEKT